MREIYKTDEIIEKIGPDGSMDNDFQKGIAGIDFDGIGKKQFSAEDKEGWVKSFGGKEINAESLNIKEINAKDLHVFNWVKYKKELDAKNERIDQRNKLEPNFEQRKTNALNAMAYDLLETEEDLGSNTQHRDDSKKRTQNRYGW
jgi:hypothetical protein